MMNIYDGSGLSLMFDLFFVCCFVCIVSLYFFLSKKEMNYNTKVILYLGIFSPFIYILILFINKWSNYMFFFG